jgi:hypothetical protein
MFYHFLIKVLAKSKTKITGQHHPVIFVLDLIFKARLAGFEPTAFRLGVTTDFGLFCRFLLVSAAF